MARIGINRNPNKGLGWVVYGDSQYTSPSPFVVQANVRTPLPNDGSNTIDLVGMEGSTTIYNPTTGRFEPQNSGDTYDVRVTLVADPTLNNRNFTLDLDIGGTQGVIWERTLRLARGANIDTKITEGMDIFTLNTFIQNGGQLNVTCDGEVSVHNITYFIERSFRNG